MDTDPTECNGNCKCGNKERIDKMISEATAKGFILGLILGGLIVGTYVLAFPYLPH
jgi:hypothetical protein